MSRKAVDGYYLTPGAVRKFKRWLVTRNLTVNSFSKNCECSRQYLERVLAGDKKVTASVRERFKKGGYELPEIIINNQ